MSRTVYQVRVAGARGPGLSEDDIAAFEALVADAQDAQGLAEDARDAAIAAASSNVVRIGADGDSIIARNHAVLFGTAGAQTQGLGEIDWVRARFTYFEFDQWNDPASAEYTAGMNAAVSGNTTTDLIARLDDVSDTAADVMCIAVGVNDIDAGTAEATILANIQTICRYYSGLGKKVLLGTIRPVAASFHADWADGGTRTLKRIALNADLATFAASEPNVFLVELDSVLGDGASPVRPKSGATSDGKHLTRYGAWLSSFAWEAALRKIVKPLVQDLPSGTSLISGSDFAGTGGTASTGASGQVATGWVVARNLGAATVACSKTAEGQVLTITPGAATNEQIQVSRASGGATIAEGVWYKSYVRLTLSASDYWRGVYWTPYSGVAQAMGDSMSGAVLPVAEDTELILETPAFVGPTGGASGTIFIRIMIDGNSPSPLVATIHEVKLVAVADPRPLHGF